MSWLSELCGRIGVTRIARVTGLDRVGVEVACAVRPRGHVLQVSNGKGLTRARARLSAALEAAELWASETIDPLELRWASLDELSAAGVEAWGVDRLTSVGKLVAPALWSSRVRLAWRRGQRAPSGREVWLPAQALHCAPPSGPSLGPLSLQWTSNGLGAHRRLEAALEHALLEVIERDQLARALPVGWTEREVHRRLLAAPEMARWPQTAQLASRLSGRGFEVYLFDARPAAHLGLSVAAALLVDADEGPIPLTAGYACRRCADEALRDALLEAAQSRLTDVHGAREDVAPMDRAAAALLARWCREAHAKAQAALPSARVTKSLVGLLARAGFPEVAVVDLSPPRFPVKVVRAVVSGLWVSELLQ